MAEEDFYGRILEVSTRRGRKGKGGILEGKEETEVGDGKEWREWSKEGRDRWERK